MAKKKKKVSVTEWGFRCGFCHCRLHSVSGDKCPICGEAIRKRKQRKVKESEVEE